MAGVKVISIFGNTGDGKSHTLNHILFDGEAVFYTSKSPSSCTVGVWAAYDPGLGLVALDTEGLLGAAANQNQRMRLLLKVGALLLVSDWQKRCVALNFCTRPPLPCSHVFSSNPHPFSLSTPHPSLGFSHIRRGGVPYQSRAPPQ